MIESALDSYDREAVSQLRILLRGEHGLTLAEEEQLIAGYLAGRVPATARQERRAPILRTPRTRSAMLLQPAVVAPAAVGLVALAALQLFLFDSQSMVVFNTEHGANGLAALLAVAGIMLLALFPLRVWLDLRGGQGEESLTAIAGSTVGIGLLELAILHLQWDTDQPVNLLNAFILGNLLVVALAVPVTMGMVVRARHDRSTLADGHNRYLRDA